MAPATTPADARTTGRRRADAQRSIDAILHAALAEVARTGDVNVSDIARAAGVGRVTLYGHFPTKEALVDAVVAHAITEAAAALDAIDVDHGPALDRLRELAVSSWRILNDHRRLMTVGQTHLGTARMRELHSTALARLEQLVARGQRSGELRADAPRDWLVATYYALLHAAADEVTAHRLEESTVGPLLATTITAALSR